MKPLLKRWFRELRPLRGATLETKRGKGLELWERSIVDTAYVDAQHLLTSETELGIELLGPVPSDSSWQQKAKLGFDLSCFTVDWEHHHVTCPQGRISKSWHQRSDNYGNPVIQVR